MRYRTFTYTVAAALAVFLLFNLVTWKAATEDLLTGRTGDLSRLGYFSGLAEPRVNAVDLPRRHIEGKDFRGEPIDMLVIGDSYSNGGAGGRNPFYQDYIASINGLSVLNIQEYRNFTPLTTIYILLNSGWLDIHRPRFVLVEAVERYSVLNIGGNVGAKKWDRIENIERFYREAEYDKGFKPGELHFINSGNFKYYLYKPLYLFSDHAFYSQVYRARLKEPLFSKGDGRDLLFFNEDLKALPMATDEYIGRMNDNLNALAWELRKRGITLVFLAAVDKYDLYYDYMEATAQPRSLFFERLRELPKGYMFIDSKEILADELKHGEKDIFYPDDTHWSWKASKKIFETVRFDGGRD